MMMRLLVLALCLASVALAAPKKKKAAKKPPPDAALKKQLSAALDAVQPEVGGCVVARSGDTKEWKVVVQVKVMLDGAGQVMEATAKLAPENDAAVASCIEGVLKKATYPAPHAPLTTAEREWTFAMQ